MTSLLISELAERAGVPVSTLRYYERIGLVEPSGRAENNYREYDEATVDRLAFIARAKRLGMSLDDVATLTEAWFAGECQPLRERLRMFVTGRIAEVRRQIDEEQVFQGQLERILVRLNDLAPATGHCIPDCGCDTDPRAVTDSDRAAAVPCSLDPGDLEGRLGEWRRLLDAATRTERGDGRLRATFSLSPGVITELTRLIDAESDCCPFLEFTVKVAAGHVALTIGGPAPSDIDQLIDAVLTTQPMSHLGR